jgi:peptidoglycan/LPS O-acetylase OafA/YrhL
MTTTTPPKYLAWIDQTKGLAILGIIFFHFFQNYPFQTIQINGLYHLGAKVGFAAVGLFFVIAGFNTSYVLARKLEAKQELNWQEWLKKRLYRLYPTYWLAIAVTLLLYHLFNVERNLSLDKLFLIAIGYPDYQLNKLLNPGFWFFSVILQFYLVAPFIFKLTGNNAIKILGLGIGVAGAIKLACIFVLAPRSWLFSFLYQLQFVGSYFFEICLGIYWGFILYQHQKFRRIDFLCSLGIFSAGLALYISLSLQEIDFLYNLGFDIFFTPIMFLGCYWVFKHVSLASLTKINFIPLIILGRYSYQIYLVHQPLLFVLLPKWNQNIFFSTDLGLGIALVITAIALTGYVAAFIKIESGLEYFLVKRPKST